MNRRAIKACVTLVAALSLAAVVPSAAFAAPRSTGPTLSLSSSAASASGTMTIPVGSTVHIASTKLDPTKQAVLYKGQWEPNSQFVGWAYVYYAGYTPDSSGNLSLDEVQNSAGTFRYQICQSAVVRGKTMNSCSPFVELVVS